MVDRSDVLLPAYRPPPCEVTPGPLARAEFPAIVTSVSVDGLLLPRSTPPPWEVVLPLAPDDVAVAWFRAMVEFLIVAWSAWTPPESLRVRLPFPEDFAVTEFREMVDPVKVRRMPAYTVWSAMGRAL